MTILKVISVRMIDGIKNCVKLTLQMDISVSSVPTILIWTRKVFVNQLVIIVRLGMRKLEIVPAVSMVMDIQSRVFAAVLQSVPTMEKLYKMIIVPNTVLLILKRSGAIIGQKTVKRFAANVTKVIS